MMRAEVSETWILHFWRDPTKCM